MAKHYVKYNVEKSTIYTFVYNIDYIDTFVVGIYVFCKLCKEHVLIHFFYKLVVKRGKCSCSGYYKCVCLLCRFFMHSIVQVPAIIN